MVPGGGPLLVLLLLALPLPVPLPVPVPLPLLLLLLLLVLLLLMLPVRVGRFPLLPAVVEVPSGGRLRICSGRTGVLEGHSLGFCEHALHTY